MHILKHKHIHTILHASGSLTKITFRFRFAFVYQLKQFYVIIDYFLFGHVQRVKKVMPPRFVDHRNNHGLTAEALFNTTNKELRLNARMDKAHCRRMYHCGCSHWYCCLCCSLHNARRS